jgi:CubicO group peptidase (beta-lactamase class C family)
MLSGWPADAISHNGFTGTSLALDPGSATWLVMLTNAVHYGRAKDGRAKDGIRRLQREVHAAVAPQPADVKPASSARRRP